ncbi:hypothetical protein NUI01_05450 [Corynebacterium sp. MC-17D]|uniref:Uncharacterized protein n=1 Tax=Corynebacterium lipophilum TaxID=2804918 RepID=A0AAW5HT18_9CORY|nr:hypothetical protein [Corynebacterium lipophilum]MCO6394638.1 hypothetical protein [Corynebacterium lipophilum]MCZ2117139.1 hypothetical protein [Corynebacterium lipophilum]
MNDGTTYLETRYQLRATTRITGTNYAETARIGMWCLVQQSNPGGLIRKVASDRRAV